MQAAEEAPQRTYIYDPKSRCADEFINHDEILETLVYADVHKDDVELCHQILDKCAPHLQPATEHGAMITHREASVLLACEDEGVNERIKQLAHDIKLAYYGNRIVLFAPLYLSNYCVNGCLYCPYHAKNKAIPRTKLTQDEVRAEV
ncbi:MAG: [Eggerthellaceae bacterium]|nr:[FeFe] hydrogenase H-cluster radical SAM maturase HydG [Eggerthellaceae bacterium]